MIEEMWIIKEFMTRLYWKLSPQKNSFFLKIKYVYKNALFSFQTINNIESFIYASQFVKVLIIPYK